jgi:O-antigen ligase
MVYGGDFFATGNFNPYTTFFVHLTDVFLMLAFTFWGAAVLRGRAGLVAEKGQAGLTGLLMTLLLAAVAMTFLSGDAVLSFFLSLRLTSFFLLYLMIANGVLAKDDVINYFLAGMAVQAGIAVLQYFLQHSAGLGFLGESQISPSTAGVAKIDFGGERLLRAYGTFSHANVLGGALFMAILLSFRPARGKLWLTVLFLALFAAALIFTFSRSAFFALVAAFLIYISINEGKLALRYVLFAVCLLLFFIVALNLEGLFFQRFIFSDTESGLERVQYMDISKNMFIEHPMGVGMGGFTSVMQSYTTEKLEPWIFQPVHNVFLLAANELGVIGGLLVLFLPVFIFYLLIKKVTRDDSDDREKQYGHILIALLAGIVTVALFDHYFFTIYAGQALFFIYLGLAGAYLKNPGLPRKKS